MKKRYINASLLILAVIAAAFVGLYAGQKFTFNNQHHFKNGCNVHNCLHKQLDTTLEQNKELMELEQVFYHNKQYLEESIRLANMELANAINKGESYSQEVQEAVDKIHDAMGKLQKATLEHFFSMKPVLDEEQNKKLKSLITDALYDNAKQ